MLEFENVSKSFWTGSQHKVILDRVSFRVDLGHSLGILAPNGTGKTTLINMMAGLEKPDEGEIRRGCNISFPLGFPGGGGARAVGGETPEHQCAISVVLPNQAGAITRLSLFGARDSSKALSRSRLTARESDVGRRNFVVSSMGSLRTGVLMCPDRALRIVSFVLAKSRVGGAFHSLRVLSGAAQMRFWSKLCKSSCLY